MDTSELETKLAAVAELLDNHHLEAMLIRRIPNFAWITCGASAYVNCASAESVASLLISPSGYHLITNNIEAPRLGQEQGLAAQGWEFHIGPWHESRNRIEELAGGLRLGADSPYPGAVDLGHALPGLRLNLHKQEQSRLKDLGAKCAVAMDRAIRSVRPGMSEHDIAALLAGEALRLDVLPIVNLIAVDDRVSAFRHPLPTAAVLKKYAMLVLCGRQHGLVCSVTRLIHFGRMPDELRRRAQAVAAVDAAFICSTQPGQRMAEVFRTGLAAYARAGFPEEWRLHHQGGPVGYEPRELLVTEATDDIVQAGQAYAWNPSITGTKSEDTILVGPQGVETLTAIKGWPMLEAEFNGQTLARPAVLEVD
jgi:Xaa-Pro aminopeptidase